MDIKYTPEDGFPYYLNLVKDTDYRTVFNSISAFTFLNSINEEKATYRYAPGKWDIKQIVGHITDHERIKIYRAFLMSRKQLVELWGYDQNSLVANSRFEDLPFSELVADFANVRKASISFIDSLSENQLEIKGRAKQYEITLRDFLKSIIGHQIHHLNIVREKYLQA